MTALKSFLKYASEEDFELTVFYNNAKSIRGQKTIKKPIEYLKPEATKAILSAYGNDTKKHRRNQVLLILMYDSGCRVQELSDLNVFYQIISKILFSIPFSIPIFDDANS